MPRFAIAVASIMLPTICVTPAHAQCDPGGHGIPTLTNVAATSSSLAFSWLLPQCKIPQKMEIRQGGTAQGAYQDGTLLGSEDLQPLMNGGVVTANNLMANTVYSDLRVCSVYADSTSWCTDPRAQKTNPGAPGAPPAPTNLLVIPTSTSPLQRTANLHWLVRNFAGTATVTLLPPAGTQKQTLHVDSNVSLSYQVFFYKLDKGIAYKFSVCNQNNAGQSCASIVADKGPAPPPAPAPVLPPASVSATWSSSTQITVTWTRPIGVGQSWSINIYHRVGAAPLLETGASPWELIGRQLSINSNSFTDTRPHLPGTSGPRHIYRVCTVNSSNTSSLDYCSTPIAAPP